MNINIATERDVSDIAKCHRQAFPSSFSSALGMPFLTKNFKWYLEHPDAFLLVDRNENAEVLGYAGGLLMHEGSTNGSSTSIMQYAFWEAVMGLILRPWLFFHREMMPNYMLIWKNIRLKLFSNNNNNPPTEQKDRTRSLGLVVIGTSKESRGKGVGSALLQAFEKRGKEIKAERLHLSVKKSNSTAIQVYTRNGWILGGEHGKNFQMYKKL